MIKTFETSQGTITAVRTTGKGPLRFGQQYGLHLDGYLQALLTFQGSGRWGVEVLNPHCPAEYRHYTYLGTLEQAAREVTVAAASWKKPTEIVLTEAEAEQVINNDPAPTGRHLRALVTVEVAERLAGRAYRRLTRAQEAVRMGQSPMEYLEEAKAYLDELVEATTTTTVSQVKDLSTSGHISAQAAEQVAQAAERVG